ncbi:aminopeptidase N-like [Galleria mellonella]|uniref:Aminopeptidase n=1 Tax=Galleria mellonella TaxID=7137 RepID=A0A6J1WM35_GALME|nr:aminopeptidase N-like [Galleria mellonella]
MLLLVLVGLLAAANGVPIANEDARIDISNPYALPGTSIPTFYDVRLFFDPNNEEYFFGNVTIRVIPTENINEIVLQAMELEIDSIEVFADTDFSQQTNLFANYTYSNETHLLRIGLDTDIGAHQPHEININYVGHYADNMFGVYLSTYEDNGRTVKLVTTQMQPTFARRAFPCYDEPGYKAVFRTTIYAPSEYPVVLSNTPIGDITRQPNVPGYVKYEFADTLPMSTYLLAYVVSEFEHIGNVDSNGNLNNDAIYNIPFRVYSRPGTQNASEFALDYGQKNMVAFENYTDFPFAFPKLDKAAIPDFTAGAMENWGLVLYREVALLVTEGVTTTATKQGIGRIISHENAHMWFGNEVSPVNWTYTWLNEGFANLFESLGTDFVLPEWRMMDQFVISMQNVFQSDAVLSVNPMTHTVRSPSEILGTFNAVAYQKSGSVIRMTQHFLTPEVFRQGIVKYLRANSRKAVVPGDLFAALQEALNESNHSIPYTVAAVLDRWTTQGGFPVINVRRSAPAANSLSLDQERFLLDRSQWSNERWHVPLNWVLSTDVDFSDTRPQQWYPVTSSHLSINIPGLSKAEWYIINKQQTGYYRVNYDVSNWQALARVLNSSSEYLQIHVLNRAQIIDDSFNLARNGRLNYLYPFEISKYLVQEKDYIPWAAANAAFSYLDIVLSFTEVYNLYKSYLLNITEPLYNELGFIASSDEEHVTAYHRNIVLDINCRYGNVDCLNKASDLLEQSKTQSINPDIQNLVFCASLRGGDRDNFDYLWSLYVASTDSTFQSILLNALGCTSNEEARTEYLNQVIDDDSPVREQDKHTVIVAVINASPENTEAALDFVIENFELIKPRVQELSGTTNILNAFSRRLISAEHLSKIQTFESRYDHIFSAGERASVAAIKENIGASIAWSEDNLPSVNLWLDDNYGNSAVIFTSNVVMMLLVVLAILF